MTMLSREDFAKDSDLKRVPVDIEGGSVLMRELSVAETFEGRRRHVLLLEGVPEDERDFVLSLALIATTLCVEGGGPMFGPDEIGAGVAALRAKSTKTIKTLQAAFARLNGASEEAIKEAVGKSTEIPSVTSSSGSPVISDTLGQTS